MVPAQKRRQTDRKKSRENKKDSKIAKENAEVNSSKLIPDWLEKDNEKLEAKVVRLATREDVDLPVEEHLIVELYSKQKLEFRLWILKITVSLNTKLNQEVKK